MRKLLLVLLLALPAVALPPVAGEDRFHTVKAGENLADIAKHYGLALEHLAWANGLPISLEAPAGRKLRVPLRRILPANPPKSGLVVNLPERGVYLFKDNRFIRFYAVSIGMKQPEKFRTPTGAFKLTEKVKNPDWHAPKWAKMKVKVVKAGDKLNPLGDRWIGISAEGVGFHATKSEDYIGDAVSHGCLRMVPSLAHELFEHVKVGMPVRIEYQPIRLGVAGDGEIVMATFPDVYKQGMSVALARQVLGQGGISPGLVNEKLLGRVVNAKLGRPIALVSRPVAVKGQSTPLALISNGRLLLATDLLRKLGLKVAWTTPGQTLEVTQGAKTETFEVNETAQLYRGRVLLPARELKETFAMKYEFDPKERVVEVPRAAR